ncbi:unnamed protein product [Caretta caretta]
MAKQSGLQKVFKILWIPILCGELVSIKNWRRQGKENVLQDAEHSSPDRVKSLRIPQMNNEGKKWTQSCFATCPSFQGHGSVS